MNKTRFFALLGAIGTLLLLVTPAFAQTVGVGTSTSVGVSVGGLGGLLSSVTGLLSGLLTGLLGGI